jgi:spermidine synthase
LDADPKMAASLAEVGILNATDLFANYAGRSQELHEWLKGAEINRDLNLRLQYLAGMGANDQSAGNIMREITNYRRYPRELFTGSAETLARLQSRLGN